MVRALALVLASSVVSSLHAAKVKVWLPQAASNFDKAKFDKAVLSSEGVVRLSRLVKPLADLKTNHVWALAEDAAGNLFAATGDEGKVYKIGPDGKSSLILEDPDGPIFSLLATPEGVLAGTGGKGKIWRLSGDAKKELAAGLGKYVWSLAYDPASKRIFAGTGPEGKIFELKADGKTEVFYKMKQDHVLALTVRDRHLYAGTDKGGVIYRIDEKGKGFVLYNASQTEVRSLLATEDAVYAGTSVPVPKKTAASSTGTKASEETRPGPAPGSGDNSVYRIAPDGSVRELLREKTLMLSLLQQGGKLLVGTGMQGQLFEIDENTKEKSEIARLDHGQIHAMLVRKDGSVVLAAGDPGKLYLLQNQYAGKGTVLSDVLDAKLQARWGALHWKANCPKGTAITVAVRSGNTPDPDETWSPWSAEQSAPTEGKALAPLARYAQFRATLSSEHPMSSPDFRAFSLRYQTLNQSPEIASLEVPDLDAASLDNPKKLKIRWSASDANDDELSYNLFFKKDGWTDWVLLEENLDAKTFDWDVTGVPSGIYQVKVTASDRKDNAPEDTLTATRISNPVPVAHLPPAVSVKFAGYEGDRAVLEATASDPLVRLVEASFAVNGKKWANVFPRDGLFDNKSETFRFLTDPLRPGTHVVVLRVRDAAGNTGSGDAVFVVPGQKSK